MLLFLQVDIKHLVKHKGLTFDKYSCCFPCFDNAVIQTDDVKSRVNT